jgi:hypothetical protein
MVQEGSESVEGSRRNLLRTALATTFAGVGATALLGAKEAEAESCKAKGKKTARKKAQCERPVIGTRAPLSIRRRARSTR